MKITLPSLLIMFSIFFCNAQKQIAYEKIMEQTKEMRLRVVKEAIIGKEYTSYLIEDNEYCSCNPTRMKFLGTITTETNETYSLIATHLITPTATCCRGYLIIEIVDSNNEYIGYYFGADILPDAIVNNQLIFLGYDDGYGCKSSAPVYISFEQGIPEYFDLGCPEYLLEYNYHRAIEE